MLVCVAIENVGKQKLMNIKRRYAHVFVCLHDIRVMYEMCLKNNGTGSINVLFCLTSKFYNMSSSK